MTGGSQKKLSTLLEFLMSELRVNLAFIKPLKDSISSRPSPLSPALWFMWMHLWKFYNKLLCLSTPCNKHPKHIQYWIFKWWCNLFMNPRQKQTLLSSITPPFIRAGIYLGGDDRNIKHNTSPWFSKLKLLAFYSNLGAYYFPMWWTTLIIHWKETLRMLSPQPHFLLIAKVVPACKQMSFYWAYYLSPAHPG